MKLKVKKTTGRSSESIEPEDSEREGPVIGGYFASSLEPRAAVSRMRVRISSAVGRSGNVSLTRRQRSRPSASTSRVVSSAMSPPSIPAPGWTKP
jgi:hypothetical protein